MDFCKNCGKENAVKDAKFCFFCGAPIIDASDIDLEAEQALIKEEQEFLDLTNLLLRWERIAWVIYSKAYIVWGGFCATISMLYINFTTAQYASIRDLPEVILSILAMLASLSCIVGGIIMGKLSDGIHLSIDELYKNFTHTNKHYKNAVFLILNLLFPGIHTASYFINLARIRKSQKTVERILTRQAKI